MSHAHAMAGIAAAVLFALLATMPGCRTIESHPDVPAAAMMGSEGAGRLAYTAPDDGMIYIYDVSADQMVYSGRVEDGERVAISPDNRRVTVDERIVSEGEINTGNLHRIFYLSEDELDGQPGRR